LRNHLLHDAEAVATVAADPQPTHKAGLNPSRPRSKDGRNTRSVDSGSSLEYTASRLDRAMHRIQTQIAGVSRKVSPMTNPSSVQSRRHAGTVVVALAAHIDELPPEHLVGLEGENHVLFGRIAQELTSLLGLTAFKCPNRSVHTGSDLTRSLRKHVEENIIGAGSTCIDYPAKEIRFADTNLRYRTVVPEWITPGGRKGMYIDIDPGCVDANGNRRRFTLEELLPVGLKTPVTLKEAAVLTGRSHYSLYVAASRVKQPLTQRGERDEAGYKAATFWIGDILATPTTAKLLPRASNNP
jgi:hypothetical protein